MTICGSRICNSRLLVPGNSSFRSGSRLLHISDIGCIGICRSATGHIRNRRIIRIDTVICHIGISAYGQSVVIDDRIARCDAVHFQIFGQFDIQRICPIGYHADISVCQLRCICHTADDICLFA